MCRERHLGWLEPPSDLCPMFFFVDIFWLAGVAPKWDHLGHRKTVLFFTFFYWSINNPSIYTWDITSSSWEAEEQVMRETTKKLARKRHSLLGKKKRKKGESNKSIVGQHMHTLDHLGSERNRSIYPPTPYRKKTSCSCFRYTPVPASPAAAAVMEVNFPSTRRRNLLGLCHLPPYDSRSLFFLFFKYLCLCCPHLLPRTKKSDIGLVLWGGKKSPPRFFRHFCAPPIWLTKQLAK